MDIKNNIKIIDNIYSSATYNSRYGLDILITIIIVTSLLVIIGYISVLNNLKSLKANWDSEKCNPINFPFVHMINRDPNKTPQEQIQDNIKECIENSINDFTIETNNSIYEKFDILNVLQEWFNKFTSFIQKLIIFLLNTIVSLVNTLISVLQKCYLGITHILISGKDIFNRLLALVVVKFFIFIQFLNIGMAFFLNFGTIATLNIMIPLGITIGIVSLLLILYAILAKSFLGIGFAKFAIPFVGPAIAAGWFTISGIKKIIVGSLASTLASLLVLFCLMGAVLLGFREIERHAQKFIAPSLRISG